MKAEIMSGSHSVFREGIWLFLLLCFLPLPACVTPQDSLEAAERALQKAQEIQVKQENLELRAAVLEQQAKKFEQMTGKLDADNATRYSQVREFVTSQDVKNKEDRDHLIGEVNSRLDDMNRQMDLLRKDIINAVQTTNVGLVKNVDTQFDSLDVVVGTLLLRLEELEKRVQATRKR